MAFGSFGLESVPFAQTTNLALMSSPRFVPTCQTRSDSSQVVASTVVRKTASSSARAGNRRFRLLSALRAHTKAPYKTDLPRKTLMVGNRPGAGADRG